MKRCLTTLLGLILFAMAGCGGGSSITETAKLNCSQVTDLAQVPAQAIAAGVDFVTALHSYDIRRIRELVVPDQREAMAKEAFNGPNASPIKMLETPKVTEGSLCGKAIRLTVRTSAEYSGGYTQHHTIYLTIRQYGNNWLIAGMAADYDS